MADRAEFETPFIGAAEEETRGAGWAAGVFVVAGAAALGVAGCAGFLAMVADIQKSSWKYGKLV